jgi:uncharacterized damage-inducible protein DinB
VRNKLLAFAIATLLVAPTLSLAAANSSPSGIFNKLFTGQQEEVISAAEAMPADKYNFAPTNGNFTGVRTFAQQVTHIASSQYYFFEDFGVKPSVDPDAIDKLTNKDEIVKALKDSYAYAHQAIDTITEENVFKQFGQKHHTRAEMAAEGLAHTNDHYGQMVVYLRMNGIIPPASRK